MKKLIASLAGLALSSPLFAADLTIYTYDSFVSEWGPGPQLEKAFEAQCQCDLEYIAVEDGVSILNRLRIEGANTKADVILGLDDALMEVTRQEGIVQAHGLKTDHLKPELNWTDNDFIPFDYGYFSFIYNSEITAQPVTSLRALLASDASIIYQDPRTSTPGQGLMMWVNAVYGEDALAAWKQLSEHTVTVTKGWWEAYSMFLQGDADYVLSYNTSPAYHIIAEGKHQYKAALFEEGHVAQVEIAAITASSPRVERAREFLQFLISEEAQKIIPVSNWMLPVSQGIELPDTFAELIAPKRIGYTPQQVAQNRKAWIKEWRSAVAQ